MKVLYEPITPPDGTTKEELFRVCPWRESDFLRMQLRVFDSMHITQQFSGFSLCRVCPLKQAMDLISSEIPHLGFGTAGIWRSLIFIVVKPIKPHDCDDMDDAHGGGGIHVDPLGTKVVDQFAGESFVSRCQKMTLSRLMHTYILIQSYNHKEQ